MAARRGGRICLFKVKILLSLIAFVSQQWDVEREVGKERGSGE